MPGGNLWVEGKYKYRFVCRPNNQKNGFVFSLCFNFFVFYAVHSAGYVRLSLFARQPLCLGCMRQFVQVMDYCVHAVGGRSPTERHRLPRNAILISTWQCHPSSQPRIRRQTALRNQLAKANKKNQLNRCCTNHLPNSISTLNASKSLAYFVFAGFICKNKNDFCANKGKIEQKWNEMKWEKAKWRWWENKME